MIPKANLIKPQAGPGIAGFGVEGLTKAWPKGGF